jgi:FkbM family methyltransferase
MSILPKPISALVPLSWKELIYSLKDRKSSIVKVEGFKLALHQHDTIISESIRNSKVWAEPETKLFRELLRPGMTVVDVGANIGYFSLLASTLVGSGGSIHAFEPDPLNCSLLKKSIRLNNVSNIEVVQMALSDDDVPISLFIDSHNKGDHRIWEPVGESRKRIDVGSTTLDDYLDQRQSKPAFIKIDVQGAEGKVLGGMKNTLTLDELKFLTLEFWPLALRKCGTPPEQILKQITDAGFTIRVVPDPMLLGDVAANETFSDTNARNLIALAEAAPFQQIDLICSR